MKHASIVGRFLLVLFSISTLGSFAHAQTDDAVVRAAIAGSLPANLKKAELDAFYSQTAYQPVFIRAGAVTNRLAELQSSIQRIERHGLNPNDYQKPEFALAAGSAAPAGWVMTELSATQTLINMARHVSNGRVNPSSISSDIKFEQKSFSQTQINALAVINNGNSIDSVIDSAASRINEYWNLVGIRTHLMDIRSRGGWAMVEPASKNLKLGVRDPKVILAKQRLADYGYQTPDMSDLYDQQTYLNVKDFQKSYQMDLADGEMGPNGPTWRLLMKTSLQSRIDEVDMNLEKIRWLPQSLESRHIFINLAFQQFRLMDPSASQSRGMDPNLPYMEFRTINGRPGRKSPTMKDRVSNLIFNPNWTVPATIFLEDKLPLIRNLPPDQLLAWFDTNGFIVLASDLTTQLDPLSIDWNSIGRENMNIYIRQTPRYNNALGVLKFLLTNPWAIYLHDTNTRDVFAGANNRALSSGCIRLERPVDLAEYLSAGLRTQFLSGNPATARAEIEAFIMKPGETRPNETTVLLPRERQIPVYTIFQTVVLGRDGVMRFANDQYSQNATIRNSVRNAGFLR